MRMQFNELVPLWFLVISPHVYAVPYLYHQCQITECTLSIICQYRSPVLSSPLTCGNVILNT